MTFKEKWNLPEIIAVSEAQRQYAEKKRESHCKFHSYLKMEEAHKVLDSLNPAALERIVAKEGKSKNYVIVAGMAKMGLYLEAMLLVTVNANELISWIEKN